jgi:recombination protein RecT
MANELAKQNPGVGNYLANVNMKKRFEDILGKKASGFMASIINVSKLPGLKDVEPMSIISSALVAATLDLPIDPNLGFAYVVPYNTKENGVYIKKGQFQMGYKGFVQLAMRTGQYKTINAFEVYEGDIKRIDRLTGEIEINEEPSKSEKIIGYIAYFKLLNGFEKPLYMSVEQMQKHAKKYSQTYKSEKDYVVKSSKWTTDFDSMAIKTVIKLLLSKYGVLSIEMQRAIETDQAVIKNDVAEGAEINNETITYPDNDNENVQDAEFKEVKETVKTKLDDKFKKDNELTDEEKAEILKSESEGN